MSSAPLDAKQMVTRALALHQDISDELEPRLALVWGLFTEHDRDLSGVLEQEELGAVSLRADRERGSTPQLVLDIFATRSRSFVDCVLQDLEATAIEDDDGAPCAGQVTFARFVEWFQDARRDGLFGAAFDAQLLL
eukprot:Sspe_Gene.74001::Locus_45292_Transcript_3_4_Confidence_0.700_Length_511::g.74001::m.74001